MTEGELKKYLEAAEKKPKADCGRGVGSTGKSVALQAGSGQVVYPRDTWASG